VSRARPASKVAGAECLLWAMGGLRSDHGSHLVLLDKVNGYPIMICSSKITKR
jgi:hypothetical protein